METVKGSVRCCGGVGSFAVFLIFILCCHSAHDKRGESPCLSAAYRYHTQIALVGNDDDDDDDDDDTTRSAA
jgi:hypothetical protein